ncbi:MAG TPA: hypothetical protein VLK85_02395, partial [Ramlibacter sp.]|nr:hypothetical protein [Ramlibacter sp.]
LARISHRVAGESRVLIGQHGHLTVYLENTLSLRILRLNRRWLVRTALNWGFGRPIAMAIGRPPARRSTRSDLRHHSIPL